MRVADAGRASDDLMTMVDVRSVGNGARNRSYAECTTARNAYAAAKVERIALLHVRVRVARVHSLAGEVHTVDVVRALGAGVDGNGVDMGSERADLTGT